MAAENHLRVCFSRGDFVVVEVGVEGGVGRGTDARRPRRGGCLDG